MSSDDLSDRFERAARGNDVTGAQLAVLRQGELRTFELGELEHGTGEPMGGSTKVPVGSITKTFTTTLLMALVSDGDLDLDAPVAEYLPEMHRISGDLVDLLTTRHLLSHTGGLAADYAGPAEADHFPLGGCFLDTLQRPGVGFSYSNLGYVLTGHLVEALTGMTWWEAMRAIVLKPMGITAASIVAPDRSPSAPSVATGHAVNRARGLIRTVEQTLEPAEAPAGALALSASDLVALGRMHLRPEHGGTASGPVGQAELAEMRRPVPYADPFGLADGWALGLALFRSGATTWLGHDGMADGTSCYLRVDPTGGTVIALTTNSGSGSAMWRDLCAELRPTGLHIGAPHALTGAERRTAPPRDCAGEYVNGDTVYSAVIRGDDVSLVVDGDSAATLTLYEDLIFSVTDVTTGEQGYAGRFLRNARDGRIDRIQIGGRVAAKRRRAQEAA